MISVIPLRRAALAVLEAGAFDGIAPPRREVYPDLPLYSRAATADGERVLQRRMGATPIAGGLVRAAPRAWEIAA